MMPLLELREATMRFGGLTAVDNLSFSVEAGAIHGLIGPNGAGKTTSFNLISGFYTPTSGEIVYQGQDIAGIGTHQTAARGLVRTFQHATLFQEFTLLENAMVGCHLNLQPTLFGAIFGNDRARRQAARARAEEVLEFFGLADRRHELASELAHGHQRALGMAVAMAANPTLMLLDEPFTGMNPEETQRMMELTFKLRDSGVTILIVEHDMHAIMGLCDRITVMSFGRLLAEGGPEEIRQNPQVIEAYLGGGAHAA